MSVALFSGWKRHIVVVEVAKIGVGVRRSLESVSFESDGGCGEDAVGAVHNAIAVVVKDIAGVFAFAA